jgi:mRNA interferase HigB
VPHRDASFLSLKRQNADWANPAAIKAAFGTASIVANNRVVFNICGNKYRLVVRVNYPYRVMYVRFIGTHAQYDRINVEEV